MIYKAANLFKLILALNFGDFLKQIQSIALYTPLRWRKASTHPLSLSSQLFQRSIRHVRCENDKTCVSSGAIEHLARHPFTNQ